MQVFLVRHADAVDDAPNDPCRRPNNDATRALTPHGRMQATCLGDRLRWYDCAPTHAWTSPFARAAETAELIVSMMTEPVALEQTAALSPHGSTREVVDALGALPPPAIALVVGHEPNLSTIAARLAGLDDFGPIARARAVRIVDGRLRWHFDWDAEAPTPYR